MKGDRKLRGSCGFTIIETMIFLAVSALMLLAAIDLVNGQQDNTEFTQAINIIQSQVQDVANDVVNGYYPSLGNFTCSSTEGNINESISASGTPVPQGSNSGCIFFGKALQFGVTGATSNQDYYTYVIVGAQCAAGATCTDLAQATQSNSITNVIPTVLRSVNGSIDATTTTTLDNGVNVVSMQAVTGSAPINVGIVAFTQALADSEGTNGGGAQSVNLYAISNTNIANEAEGSSVTNLNNYQNWISPSSVTICFSSGTTTQSGLITIGGQNRQISVTLKIYRDLNCS